MLCENQVLADFETRTVPILNKILEMKRRSYCDILRLSSVCTMLRRRPDSSYSRITF